MKRCHSRPRSGRGQASAGIHIRNTFVKKLPCEAVKLIALKKV
jgi:hypothetical protein